MEENYHIQLFDVETGEKQHDDEILQANQLTEVLDRKNEVPVIDVGYDEFGLDYATHPASSNLGLTELFTTNKVFDSKEAVRDWCMELGKTRNCVIVCKSSRAKNLDTNGKGSYLEMQCERSGLHVSHKGKNHIPKITNVKKRNSGTKKCGCPFMLSALCGDNGKWRVQVKCGSHNHDLPKTLTGHAYVARLKDEEFKKVESFTVAGAKPRNILTSIKQDNKDNYCTIRTMYNVKAKLKEIWNEGRSVMQQFMKLSEHKYTVEHKSDPITKEVTDLFFAHPKYVLLAQCFHKFILVDNTYKTNRYKLPLFHVVSHKSTGKTFTVALAFMSREKIENYIWALRCVKRLYRDNEVPSVVVYDADSGLISAVEYVFPMASHLLCTWHIGNNVYSKCAKHFRIVKDNSKENDEMGDTVETNEDKKNEEENNEMGDTVETNDSKRKAKEAEKEKTMKLFDNFMDDWKYLCWSLTVEEYCRRYKQFCTIWSPKYSISVNYVAMTWVESAHGELKKYFGTSQGSFVTCWYNAHQRFENDFMQIQSDFEGSATRTMLNFSKQPMFQMLLNNVSHLGLRLLNDELKRVDKHGSDTKKCGCVIRTTNGLPCAHMLLQFKVSHFFIPLSAIDSFYRQLTTTPPVKDRTTKAFQHLLEIKSIEKVWDASTDSQRGIMQSDLGVLGNPKTNYFKEPKMSEIQHGRPTKLQQMKNKTTKRNLSEFELVKNALTCAEETVAKKTFKPQASQEKTTSTNLVNYLVQLPVEIQPFVNHIEDLNMDGYCGYWVMVKQLKLFKKNAEEPWRYVRDQIVKNLRKMKYFYESMWDVKGFNDLMENIAFPIIGVDMDVKYWMTMPEAGFLIAETFTTVVVVYSEHGSYTFVPNHVRPSNRTKGKTIYIGFVDGPHFVSLQVESNASIPPYPSYDFAEKALTDYGREWLVPYKNRIAVYEALTKITRTKNKDERMGTINLMKSSKNNVIFQIRKCHDYVL